ncbi:MAG: AraC family ligand binding domain-containing protein, partial [Bacteroidota bacterium]|nr:AraC family ligand binding domain-containing protein [Bacteroidota bacterium]
MKNGLPFHNFSADDESSVPFKIVPIEKNAPYDTSVPHRHNYYEVFFFTQGGGTHFIDFRHYPIVPNSIHIVSPGQVHKVQREEG